MHEGAIFLLVQKLRKSTSNHLVDQIASLMDDSNDDQKFISYLDSFFNVLKLKEEFEIIDSSSIRNKCVLIEKENLFFTSKSLNLRHHS